MVIKDIDAYIRSLQVRINNWYARNEWRADSYLRFLDLNERLDIIRHDHYNGHTVQARMLGLNRVLITKEGQPSGKRFLRSAQSRANIYSGGR
jgi:hypothetical protein